MSGLSFSLADDAIAFFCPRCTERPTDRDPFTFGERPTDYPRLLENDLGAKNGMEWRWRRSKLRGDSKNGVVIC